MPDKYPKFTDTLKFSQDMLAMDTKPMHEIQKALAKELSKKLEVIVKEAVTLHLGTSEWDEEEIGKRMIRGFSDHCKYETWCLDGNPILLAGQPQARRVIEGDSTMLRWTIGYKILPVPEKEEQK